MQDSSYSRWEIQSLWHVLIEEIYPVSSNIFAKFLFGSVNKLLFTEEFFFKKKNLVLCNGESNFNL